jgi:1,4-alpha-glucan branching enzyme
MKRVPSGSVHRPDLYVLDRRVFSRRKVLPLIKPVSFHIRAPQARAVWLAGRFTDNGFQNYPMHKTIDGYWECSVELKRGHYEYYFVVDGVPTVDPRAHGRVPDGSGGYHSLVEVE